MNYTQLSLVKYKDYYLKIPSLIFENLLNLPEIVGFIIDKQVLFEGYHCSL